MYSVWKLWPNGNHNIWTYLSKGLDFSLGGGMSKVAVSTKIIWDMEQVCEKFCIPKGGSAKNTVVAPNVKSIKYSISTDKNISLGSDWPLEPIIQTIVYYTIIQYYNRQYWPVCPSGGEYGSDPESGGLSGSCLKHKIYPSKHHWTTKQQRFI